MLHLKDSGIHIHLFVIEQKLPRVLQLEDSGICILSVIGSKSGIGLFGLVTRGRGLTWRYSDGVVNVSSYLGMWAGAARAEVIFRIVIITYVRPRPWEWKGSRYRAAFLLYTWTWNISYSSKLGEAYEVYTRSCLITYTEMRFILCTWFGEFCSCCSSDPFVTLDWGTFAVWIMSHPRLNLVRNWIWDTFSPPSPAPRSSFCGPTVNFLWREKWRDPCDGQRWRPTKRPRKIAL